MLSITNKHPVVFLVHVPHRAINDGFIPAVRKLQFPVIVVTDHPRQHEDLLRELYPDIVIIECDVFNPLAVLSKLIDQQVTPSAIFSNSDHLQASTAIVAQFYQCSGKNWEVCFLAKNKIATRNRQHEKGQRTPWFGVLDRKQSKERIAQYVAHLPYPIVAKPSEGVASMGVCLCTTPEELSRYAENIQKNGSQAILLEEFIEGSLFTLETLGDGKDLMVIGGFDVTLSPPPHFVEMAALWNGPEGMRYRTEAINQIKALGVGFGVCHTEFIATPEGPVLVEINYRSIGDGREFLLNRLTGGGWFKSILKLHLGYTLNDIQADFSSHSLEQTAGLHYCVAQHSGYLKKAPASFTKTQGNLWLNYTSLIAQGSAINLTYSNKDYLGILQLIAPDAQSYHTSLGTILKSLDFEIGEQVSL